MYVYLKFVQVEVPFVVLAEILANVVWILRVQ